MNKFELSPKQEIEYKKWKDSLPKVENFAAIGGGYWFKFTPTGLGTVLEVGRTDVPHLDINLTEWDIW